MKGELMKTQGKSLLARVSVSLLICGLIVFWGFQVSGEEWTEAQKEVWKIVETDWEYCKQGDVKAVMAGRHDGSLTWWPTRAFPLGKRGTKLSFENWFFKDKPVSYELKPLNIHIFGDVANVFYLYKWEGKVLPKSGRNMATYVKQNNKWELMGTMGCSCEKLPVCK